MNNFEKKLYFTFTIITNTAAAKIRIVASPTDTIDLGYITRFENIFSIIVNINLRSKID